MSDIDEFIHNSQQLKDVLEGRPMYFDDEPLYCNLIDVLEHIQHMQEALGTILVNVTREYVEEIEGKLKKQILERMEG